MRARDWAKGVGDAEKNQTECQGDTDHARTWAGTVNTDYGGDAEDGRSDGKEDE
jgi:hypothetical protein